MKNFSHQYLQDSNLHSKLVKEGVVKIESAISPQTINHFLDHYKAIENEIANLTPDHYTNSFSFQDPEIKKKIFYLTKEILAQEINQILISESYKIPIAGGICINPPFSKRGSNIHQDPTCIDERKTYSLTIWIPLADVNMDNGVMQFIKGSHLWGNRIRSIHTKWRFEEWKDILSESLTSIPVKLGDVIVFDSSIIHASLPNKTNETRLAVNYSCIPFNSNLIYYTPLAYPFGRFVFKKLNLDTSFFLKESIFAEPSQDHQILGLEVFYKYFSKRKIQKLLERS